MDTYTAKKKSNRTASMPAPGKQAVVLCFALLLVSAGCALPPRAYQNNHEPRHQQKHRNVHRKQQKQKPKPVDAGAQQYYYDLGLQQYSGENYRAARASFQKVVDNGPKTLLGSKARENIRKIDRILKTLNEIESK